MSTVTMMYHTPYHSEEYLDAMSNLSLSGYNEVDLLMNIIEGIHLRQTNEYRRVWIQNAKYDFPYDGEDISMTNWEEFLYHYYMIIERHIQRIVQPIPTPPRRVIVANIDYNEMVIDYVF